MKWKIPLVVASILLLFITPVYADSQTHSLDTKGSDGRYFKFDNDCGLWFDAETIHFGDSNGLWAWVNDDGIRFYNLRTSGSSCPTNWYLTVSGPANVTITELFTQELTANLFEISVTAGFMVTSTTNIYCGSHGEPTSVSGATSWSYNEASQVATVRVLHQSTETVSLRWTDYERTRNVIVSRGLIAISLVSVSFVLIVAFGIIMFTSGQAGGEDFVTVILTFGVFLVVAFLMAVIIGNFTGI